ncbi:hypothetical protein [Ancylobacter pratisalsi]|uniref:Uncharacterized protein n=1 Tax=Ancylobacter pratisalsi TaxID=1745854 RepID=A0A6P1YPH4_9HYPH|nr:hypothetical protein [Ancylobacter pratisalsi]QIB34606.1 hypothetical protein G3A50_13430 [Ancylobacter pratisalsi]
MIDPNVIKALAAICSVIGSILLAIRVKGLLEALTFVAKMHESNIHELSSGNFTIVIARGSTQHIENARRAGLLMTGFVFLILSGLLNLWAAFV